MPEFENDRKNLTTLDHQLRTEVPLKGRPAQAGQPGVALTNTHQTSPRGNEAAAPRFTALEAVEKRIKTGAFFGGPKGTQDEASIRALQELLHATRHGEKVEITGKMDAATQAAIKSLQYANGARGKENDGIVGPQTLKWLKSEYDLHLVREQKPQPKPGQAAGDQWVPLLDHHGNQHKGYGEPFPVKTSKGTQEPILVNLRTGDIKVPEGFIANDRENQQTLLRAAAAQGEVLKMIPGRSLLLRPGARPTPDEQDPAPGMVAGWEADRREDNRTGQNAVRHDGTGMARTAASPQKAVAVNYDTLIQQAIKGDGIISAHGGNAAAALGAELQRSGVINTGVKSELEALAKGAAALQAGIPVNPNDVDRAERSGGGGGGKGGFGNLG